jgi:hypothetical protein
MHSSKAAPAHKAKRSRQQPAASGASSSSSPRRLLPVTVDAAAEPGHVLAAAGRNAIMGLQHQQLVAAFERIEQGIDSWQLAPVAEEGSEGWEDEEEDEEEEQQQQQQGSGAVCSAEAGEPVVDQTFLTGELLVYAIQVQQWAGDAQMLLDKLVCGVYPCMASLLHVL